MVTLLQCGRDGRPLSRLDVMPSELLASCEQTALFHQRIGYEPPWVSYIAAEAGCGVGGGAFVGAPREGVVEIAYFTLPQFEGRGYATQTARALVDIARQAKPHIILKAFTLPQANASTRILERLGFKQIGWAQDADAGAVWEWRTS